MGLRAGIGGRNLGTVGAWGPWLLLWAGLCACRTNDNPVLGPPIDAAYGEIPPRTVVHETPPDARLEDAPGVGSVGIKDTGVPLPAMDVAPKEVRPPAPQPTVDARGGVCSVVEQDCVGRGKGCYPDASGEGECLTAGEFGDHTDCAAHSDCAPGLICVEAFGPAGRVCEPACTVGRPESCVDALVCRRYAGMLGFCVP